MLLSNWLLTFIRIIENSFAIHHFLWTYAFCGAIWGAVFGSFADVVADRTIEERKWWGSERSHCPVCGKTLTALELIPIFSFLFQRGKCKGCGSQIPFECLAVEILSASLYFVLWGFHFPFSLSWCIGTLLLPFFLVHAITDFKTHMVYDLVSLVMLAIAVIGRTACWAFGYNSYALTLPGIAAIVIICGFFAILAFFGWIGAGDVILMAALGCATGSYGLFFTIYAAFVFCMIFTCIRAVYTAYTHYRYHFVGLNELSSYVISKIRETAFCPWLCFASLVWIIFFSFYG